MIRAFVALSLLVLGLLLYSIKGGHWIKAPTQEGVLVQNDTENSDGKLLDSIGARSLVSDDLGLETSAAVDKKVAANETDLSNAKAAADLKKLSISQPEEKAAQNKQDQDSTKTDAAKMKAAKIQAAEIKAELASITESRLRQETGKAIQEAKQEAIETASKQINVKIEAVQKNANEKIEKAQSLLQALRQERDKLSAKNEELDKLRQEALVAANQATTAAHQANLAAIKTAKILGSSEKFDDAAMTQAIAGKKEEVHSDTVIRTVDDAKRLRNQDTLPQEKNVTVPGSGVRASLSSNTAKKVSPLVRVNDAKDVLDPVTGFRATNGYSTFASDRAKLLFSFASSALTDSARIALDRTAEAALRKSADIELTGFSDGTGSKEAQVATCLARTASVKSYLVSKGISQNKILTGVAALQYPHDNSTAEGRMLNRRVEALVK